MAMAQHIQHIVQHIQTTITGKATYKLRVVRRKVQLFFYPVEDEKDKGTVKGRFCTVVREPHILSIISPVAVCRKHHN